MGSIFSFGIYAYAWTLPSSIHNLIPLHIEWNFNPSMRNGDSLLTWKNIFTNIWNGLCQNVNVLKWSILHKHIWIGIKLNRILGKSMIYKSCGREESLHCIFILCKKAKSMGDFLAPAITNCHRKYLSWKKDFLGDNFAEDKEILCVIRDAAKFPKGILFRLLGIPMGFSISNSQIREWFLPKFSVKLSRWKGSLLPLASKNP